MEQLIILIYFIFGCILGSFFHVVATRVSNKESIVYPASHCPKCNHMLKWYELIPIFSYLIQRGKCRVCKGSIPFSYLIVELVTGILFSVSYHVFGFSLQGIISLVFISSLIIVIISDIEYMIILDEVLLFGAFLILFLSFFEVGFFHIFEKIGYGCLAFLTMYMVKVIGDKIFKKESLGGGDIKLMFLFGVVLGYPVSVLCIFLATFIAFPIALFVLFSHKDNIIPFGPFLCMSAIFLHISRINLTDVIMYLINF